MSFTLGASYFLVSQLGKTPDGKDSCLNVWGDNVSANGTNVTTYGASNVNSQKWVVRAENGHARIYSAMASTTKCLDFSRLSSNYGNSDIYQKSGNETDTLLEVYTVDGNQNLYRICAINHSRYLTASGTGNGANVSWQPASGGANQIWKFTTSPNFSGGSSGTLVPGHPAPGLNLNSNNYNSRGGNTFPSGQCTWYAWGRMKEKVGFSIGFTQPSGRDAKLWWTGNMVNNMTKSSTPRKNSIIVWGNNSKPGHVAFVEDVVGNTLYLSEGNGRNKNGYIFTSPTSVIGSYYNNVGHYLLGYLVR